MANYESIVGPIRGKVGSVVGCRRGGVAYLRSVPSKSGRATASVQKVNRGLFGSVVRRLRPFVGVIRRGYAPMGSAWQRAVSANLSVLRAKAEAGGGKAAVLEPGELLLSSGTCPFPVSVRAEGGAVGSASVSWGAVGEDSRLHGGTVVCVAWREGCPKVAVGEADVSQLGMSVPLGGLPAEGELWAAVFGCCEDFSTRCTVARLDA